MTVARAAFLERVRRAVAAGNAPGSGAPIEARGQVGYQGAGADPVARFREELTTAGGHAHIVPDPEAGVAVVLELTRMTGARRVLLGRGVVLDRLDLSPRLREVGVKVGSVDTLSIDTGRDPFFAADIGIGGVAYLIAETGSVALLARAEEPRSLSLLPPIHIVVADRSQLLPDLFDLFEPALWEDRPGLPSCLTLITGPSKTGDIELRLVTGVHGPGELHVVLIGA